MNNEYLYNSLEEALKDLDWFTLIDDVDYKQMVKNFFNPEKLDEDGTPNITTTIKTVIVCDNVDWNSTYLIDETSKVLKKTDMEKFGTVQLVYCNNLKARLYMKNPYSTENFIPKTPEGRADFEKKVLEPCIFVINPQKNVIVQIKEQLGTIHENMIENILKWLDDDYCDKMKAADPLA